MEVAEVTDIGSGGPSKGVLDRIAVSNCIGVMPIEPCAVVFSFYLVVLYITLICYIVCLTSDSFKLRVLEVQTRLEQARQRYDNTEPTSSAPSNNTGRRSLASWMIRPSILDLVTLKDPGVISFLACFTMPVVFGIGNVYAIFNRDVDLMWTSVVILTLVIFIMVITSTSIAIQKRSVSSIILSIVWICFNLYGGLLLYSFYKELKDEERSDRT